MREMGFMLLLCLFSVSALSRAAVEPQVQTLLAQTEEKQNASMTIQNMEVSSINDRIFDDAWEKSNFEQRKEEMNKLVAPSKSLETRLSECQGACGEGLNLFTVWTTPAEGWNNKYTHSIDSALYHHPKAKVSIFSSSLPEDFLDDFKRLGYDVHIQRINLLERAQGTPLASWAERLSEWHDGPYFYAHLSDATRLLILYKEGGVYFDTDVVFVNPIDTVKNAVGWERPDSLCNAMMSFERGNPYLEQVLTRFNSSYVKADWAANGPDLLTDVYMQDFKNSSQVTALDQSAFYMIQWDDVQHFFEKSRPTDVERDFFIISKKAYVVHFWNSRSHDLVVHQDSLMGKMFTTFCVFCNPITHPVLAINPPLSPPPIATSLSPVQLQASSSAPTSTESNEKL